MSILNCDYFKDEAAGHVKRENVFRMRHLRSRR